MMNEISPIAAVRPGRNGPIGRHQPTALIIVDGDATELWHQRLLPADQLTQALNLCGAAPFGFQALDEPEQKRRALADNAFGVGSQRLGQIQAMDIHIPQYLLSRCPHFPDSQ
ncbi:DNA-binding helix-turn-helix protein [Pseudomonas sp. St29]|nr:DNA-binding helix-turn-helix protein [Pseudomonas sp. St29]